MNPARERLPYQIHLSTLLTKIIQSDKNLVLENCPEVLNTHMGSPGRVFFFCKLDMILRQLEHAYEDGILPDRFLFDKFVIFYT